MWNGNTGFRRLAGRGLAGLLLTGAVLMGGMASLGAYAPLPGGIGFEVLRDGTAMGSHTLVFEQRGEDLHVTIEIDLAVQLAFVTLYRYEHRNHEVWRDGRLIAIKTTTDNDGDRYWVEGEASAEGFHVRSTDGVFTAPADVMPTSYWNPAFVDRSRLLDTQHGKMIEVQTQAVGEETLTVAGESLQAIRYRTTGAIALETWYTTKGAWVKTAFQAKGSNIEYTRLSAAGDAQSALR